MRYKTYKKYKDSGVEWLGKIPEEWKIKRLKFIVKFVKGRLPEQKLNEKANNLLPYLSMKYLRNMSSEIEYVPRNDKAILVENSDLVLLWDGSNAGEFIKGRYGVLSSTMAKGKLQDRINSNYLFFMCKAFENTLREFSTGMGIPHVDDQVLNSVFFPSPSLTEQGKIAHFLDQKTAKIDQLIQKNKKLIKLLEEKRQATITQAVTKGLGLNVEMKDSGVEWIGRIPISWKIKKIRRLCKIRRGASPRPIDDLIYFDNYGEYGWVRISDVTSSERYLLTTTQKLSKLGKSLSVPLEPGSLFLSIAGSVGKPIITKIKCCIHDGFVYFVNLNISKEYLYYIFISGEAYKGLGKLGTQLNLNTDTIGDILLPIPSRKKQEEIVRFLDKKINRINLIVSKTHLQNKKLEEYRQALISNAVTGKIKTELI